MLNERRSAIHAALLSAVFFIASFGGLALLGPSETGGYHTCIIDEAGNLAREGDVIRWERSLWPPGIRCNYNRPNGHDVSVIKPVTVAQVGFLVLLCSAAGTLAAYLLARRMSSRKARSTQQFQGEFGNVGVRSLDTLPIRGTDAPTAR